MAEPLETLHFLDYWQVIRSRKEVVITFTLLVILAGIVITFYTPKKYMASTVIQVRRDSSDLDVFSREQAIYDPLFLRTQFQIIQSDTIIAEVVKRLKLDEILPKAYKYDALTPEKISDLTVALISDSMKANQYRDTDLIEVQIRLKELGGEGEEEDAPRLVAEVANTIAEVYRDQSLKRKRDGVKRALDALGEELDGQNKRVEEAQNKVERIRKEQKITVLVQQYGTASDARKLNLRALEEKAITSRLELEAKKVAYEKANSLSESELLAAAPHLQPDATLSRLVMSRYDAEVSLNDKLRAKLGPNHPDVLAAQAIVDGLDKKISEALVGLKTGLLTALEAAQAQYKWLSDELTRFREEDRASESGAYREFNMAMDELKRVQEIRDNLEDRYIKEKIEMKIPKSMVEVVEYAKPPDVNDPVSPDIVLNIVLSAILGLGVGVGLAYFTEYLDTSVKTIEDVEKFLGSPVIGVIPQKVKPFNDPAADQRHAEAYRMVRANIQFSRKMKDGKVICLTSGSMGEGKSLTVFNLAYTAAELGDRVLIVDADLHRPKQHRMLKISNNVGLANILAGEVSLEDAILATNSPNLDVITAGKMASGVHGLLDNLKLHELILTLKENYDMIIFDAPPIIGVADTSMLIREMDGVVMVIQHRKYPKSVSSRAKSMIENMGANLIGVLLNNINISRDYASYHYHSYTYN